MPVKHIVEPGECISSIAYLYGFFADSIWNDSSNNDLKKKRKDMNCLCAGDEVMIPDKSEKEISFPSGKRKRFKRKGVPAELRLQIIVGDRKIANAPYVITIDKKDATGNTDSDGNLVISISPIASRARIIVRDDDKIIEYDLLLGSLDSSDSISGVQARLRNIGFVCNDPDGEMGKDTIESLKAFQFREGLAVTGELDEPTKAALEKIYDY